jgi:hypothetical protein
VIQAHGQRFTELVNRPLPLGKLNVSIKSRLTIYTTANYSTVAIAASRDEGAKRRVGIAPLAS